MEVFVKVTVVLTQANESAGDMLISASGFFPVVIGYTIPTDEGRQALVAVI